MRTLALLLALSGAPAKASDAGVQLDAAAVFKRRCQACHGQNGDARTPVGEREGIADFRDAAWQAGRTDVEISRVIREGSSESRKMPSFEGKLSAAEIEALVSYIRGLKGI